MHMQQGGPFAGQIKCLQLRTRPPHRQQFGMRGRIVARHNLIMGLTDDFAILDDHAAERTAVSVRRLDDDRARRRLHSELPTDAIVWPSIKMSAASIANNLAVTCHK